ncbi:MAG: hypothetical protein ABI338_03000 [Gemmatimonadaceae bacterium]
MKRSLVACLVLAATACQSYSTVTLSSVPVGANVQLDLTDNAQDAVAADVGSHVAQLEGRVTSVGAARMTIVLTELTRSGGTTEEGENRTVTVPADAVAVTRIQSLSAPRSLLLAGAVIAGSILIGRSLGGGAASSSGAGGTATGQ